MIKFVDDARTAALPREINLIRGLIPQRLVSSLAIVKREIGLETGLDLGQGFIVLEIKVFILDGSHRRSTKILSAARPRPSMLIRIGWAFNTAMKASLVN